MRPSRTEWRAPGAAVPPPGTRRSLKRTLLLWFLATSLIPLTVVSAVSYYTAKESLRDAAHEELVTIVAEKVAFINNWFHYRFIDLELQSTNISNARFLGELHDAFLTDGKELGEFVKSYRWNVIVNERGEDLKTFRKLYGYHDVIMLDVEGNILFTVAGKDDLGTNLFDGPLAGTRFAGACRTALDTGRSAFSDLEHHAQFKNSIAGFLTSVIVDEDGEKIGSLAVQLPYEWIENEMREETELEAGVLTYIIGYSREKDGVTLRTALYTDELTEAAARSRESESGGSSSFLDRRVDTDQTRLWQAEHAQDGTEAVGTTETTFVYDGPNGVRVLGVHQDFSIAGVGWGVIAEIPEHVAFAAVNSLRTMVIGLVLATGMVVAMIATVTTRRIVRPIVQLSEGAERVARGDLTRKIEIESTNELGELARSFNRMVTSLREAASLQESQDWFQTGQTGLTDRMRGEQEIASLTRNVVTYLAKCLNAQIGAFYVHDGQRRLRLLGSYAFQAPQNFATEFSLGEGLVGQAAIEKEHILLTNVPDDYIAVSSGLGQAQPRNILIWPIAREDEVKGVIELGALEVFEDRCFGFLNQVTENIGIALDVAQARQRQQELLEESQTQSEALQAQTVALQAREEELKDSNRNLAEKTARLQASEESLQQQSEELHATNEELKEKTESLERQKRDLEQIKRDVEEKAEELALANTSLEEQTALANSMAAVAEMGSQSKSEFLANMSHELRTPLNSLLILSKSLADNAEGNLTPEQVESANVIHGAGQELLTLINDILDLAKVESGKLEAHIEPINLRVLADGMGRQFAPLAEQKGLTLEINLADDLPETLTTDGQKVGQILRNLFSNAFKFTQTGSITLQVRRPDVDTRFLHSDLTPDDAIAFSVIDTGIGIPEDKQEAIFESFQQADGSTSRNYGGTGLGLTISREFARLLGGEILLQSRQNEGSAFTLCLPLEPIPQTKAGLAPAPASGASGDEPEQCGNLNDVIPAPVDSSDRPFLADDRAELGPDDRSILIVEDDRRFAQVLMALCREKGFKCLAAGTGGSALQIVAKYKPSAVLLDLGLPDMDGMAVLDELKHNLGTRHIPVHIISGRDLELAALTKGALGFLKKPVSSDDVLQTLEGIEKLLHSTVKHLLVIEDDNSMRELIANAVRFKGVEITETASGEEAYRKVLSGMFDCLILDLGLEDMNGFELLQKLKDESVPTPPVIVYTGEELSADELRGLEMLGCSVVLKDPAAMGLLADKVGLFLHSVESALPENQRRAIQMLHDPAEMLKEKKILVVDDDMRNTFALSKVLEKTGMKVILAENGQLALDALAREDDVDLVVMDIMMPVMDGYEAIRRIRQEERTAKLPIIALTAKAMPEDRAECFEAGANDYVTKPVDVDRLLSLIRVWIFNK